MECINVEVWILVGEDGTYEVRSDPEDFDYASFDAGTATRMVKAIVKVPAPKVTVIEVKAAEEE